MCIHTTLALEENMGIRIPPPDNDYILREYNYFLGHPVPEKDDEPEKQNHNDWTWLPLFVALTILAYLRTPKQDPIPEVSFPFFLQHMLYTGEVYDT